MDYMVARQTQMTWNTHEKIMDCKVARQTNDMEHTQKNIDYKVARQT